MKNKRQKVFDPAFRCQEFLLSVKITGFKFMLSYSTTLKENSSGKTKQQHQERPY